MLSSVEFVIADLTENMIGLASGNVITIDTNAASYGCDMDATPFDDDEFDGKVQGIDLLTTVMHELAHTAGTTDVYDTHHANDLMSDIL